MEIKLNQLGKKYHRNWIFKNLNTTVNSGEIVAITGHNGSGKSTLLKTIGGFTTPTTGQVLFDGEKEFDQTKINLAAPYLNLLEEFTLCEILDFHSRFKAPLVDLQLMLSECGLASSSNKLIQEFSSGMKQRVRLIMAFCFDSEIILLDEPSVNLDESGTTWYLKLLKDQRNSRTTIIASNQPAEYPNATQQINLNPQ